MAVIWHHPRWIQRKVRWVFMNLGSQPQRQENAQKKKIKKNQELLEDKAASMG